MSGAEYVNNDGLFQNNYSTREERAAQKQKNHYADPQANDALITYVYNNLIHYNSAMKEQSDMIKRH